MYELIPRPVGATAKKLILLFFFGASALMLITMLVPSIPFRWVFQLIALGLLTAAVFLVTRYVTKLFFYRLEQTQSGIDLTVTEASANGKRQITVCRIGLNAIEECVLLENPVAEKERLREIRKACVKLYDYTLELHPAQSIFLIVTEGGERLAIRLSYDKTLFDLLSPQDNENSIFNP